MESLSVSDEIGRAYPLLPDDIFQPSYPSSEIWIFSREAYQTNQTFQETLLCCIYHFRAFSRITPVVFLRHDIRTDIWKTTMQFDDARRWLIEQRFLVRHQFEPIDDLPGCTFYQGVIVGGQDVLPRQLHQQTMQSARLDKLVW